MLIGFESEEINMKVELFDYELEARFIAQSPAQPRDASRLMVLDRQSGAIEHRVFRDIAEYLRSDDLLVLNDTRVFPARVFGVRRTLGKVEALFLERRGPRLWRAMLGAKGHILAGEKLRFAGGIIEAEVTDKDAEGFFTLRILKPDDLMSALEAAGSTPLPPYIRRDSRRAVANAFDRERYQTVYAEKTGAVAAPTAGLHFTGALLDSITRLGVRIARVTLHVGPGTFRPVKTDEVEQHVMHSEYFEVEDQAAAALNAARAEKRRVVCIGTTTARVLESLPDDEVTPVRRWTDIFIRPPYRFRRVDALVTNFHLPRSTLLMMVSAFAGRERILAAYEIAKQEGYRFYSYGDAMLII